MTMEAMSETGTAACRFSPEWYDSEKPDVSVVILNYNKPDLTRTCLERLWANTSGRRYEIIVVDNGSTPENVAPLRNVPGPMRLLRLDINRFFGEGNNIGAELARGTYVLFLNNDAFVTPGWLEPLVGRLEQEPLLGGVGPRFLYPDGRVQEAGAFIGPDGVAVQVGKFGVYASDDVEEDHVVDYCSAACFLMRRDFFLEIGGFEYAYEPAYYEDVDLCLKIAARGLFVGYCSQSHVVHIENATSSTHREGLGLHNIIDVNRQQFLRGWGERLAARDAAVASLGMTRAPAPLRSSGPPRAVFYTPFDITPGGGERYLLTAAAALLDDFDVYLATEETYSRTRLRAIGRDLAVDTGGLRLTRRRELGELGEIAFAVTMSNEALPPFPAFSPRSLYLCQFPFPQHWSEDVKREGNLDSFAGTVVYSDFVREHLQRTRASHGLGDHPIEVIAPPVPLAPPGTAPSRLAAPYRFVLIGRFFAGGHNKRHDVAIELVRRLVAAGVPVALDIVGTLPPQAAHREHFTRLCALAEGLPVTFHANATPATIRNILAAGHFYVHAAGYEVDVARHPHECEHFGISVLEAMSYGLVPIVVANGGPATFVHDGQNGYTYRDITDVVERVQGALASPNGLAAIRANAIETAAGYAEGLFAARWRARATALLA
jgi:GT2 family glycosyltransferase/glycosyltransferase involved in cell wall biosynthesis